MSVCMCECYGVSMCMYVAASTDSLMSDTPAPTIVPGKEEWCSGQCTSVCVCVSVFVCTYVCVCMCVSARTDNLISDTLMSPPPTVQCVWASMYM